MRIAVLGTLGVELVARVERFPRGGETAPARQFIVRPGGSGLVQAAAAARLGAEATAYGCVGGDDFGDQVLGALASAGAQGSPVSRIPTAPTGAWILLVNPEGHRLGAGAVGANGWVDEGYVGQHLPRLREEDVVLLDLTLPRPGLASLVQGLSPETPIVASHPLPKERLSIPWERISFVVGTADELGVQAGPGPGSEEIRLAHPILDAGVRNLVVTGIPDGTYLIEPGGITRFPSHGLANANPAGAVDAFCAALATRLAAGRGLYEAIGFASAAAALAGAAEDVFASLPTTERVLALLSPRPPGPAPG